MSVTEETAKRLYKKIEDFLSWAVPATLGGRPSVLKIDVVEALYIQSIIAKKGE